MKVSVFGGSGFVGDYKISELVKNYGLSIDEARLEYNKWEMDSKLRLDEGKKTYIKNPFVNT